jgi:hypothetical protein
MDTITHWPTNTTCSPYVKTILMIWDGEKWVDEDSQAGVDVKNKVLRS